MTGVLAMLGAVARALGWRKAGAWLAPWLLCASAWGQVAADPWQGLRIEAVRIEWSGMPEDAGSEAALQDRVRRALGLYPGTAFRGLLLDWGLGKVRALPFVTQATAYLRPGDAGGVVVAVSVASDPARVAPGPSGFPVLHQDADSLVKVKLMAALLGYGNTNAWYGQPAALVGANPLADHPSGAGWAPWGEAALELGLQAIGPLAPSVYGYGSLSYLQSGSAGRELFTNRARRHGGIEDAYAGLVSGTTWDDGARLVLHASVGRQPFQISDGMLIRITAGNGFDRAALQLNPRWAADNLWLVEARYNATSVELFRLDPDELPATDARTLIDGINVETGIGSEGRLGFTYLHVPRSDFAYYTAGAVGQRAGLNVWDVRASWQPAAPGSTGPYARAELGVQNNRNNPFPMRAWGGFVEAGYTRADLPWRPTFSYRFSGFSGDDPATATYERWDPLLSGGTPEEWVQGVNHYKVFQDANVRAHRLQVKLRPTPQTELVSQYWHFSADQTNNLGGVLSTLAARPLGWEINLTAKYFPTRNLYVQAGVAATFPLSGVTGAVDARLSRWLSAMAMVRFNY